MNDLGQTSHRGTTDTNDCIQFERRLDRYLDGRQGVESLSSDGHLKSCEKCQMTLDVYRQFSDRGGAVLNGGNGGNRRNLQTSDFNRRQRSQNRSSNAPKLAFKASSVLVAAALLIVIAMSLPRTGDESELASMPSLPLDGSLMDENPLAQLQERYKGRDFESAAAVIRTTANRLVKRTNGPNRLKGSRGSDSNTSTLNGWVQNGSFQNGSYLRPLAAIGQIGDELWEYRLPRPLDGFQSPLFYTAELPGIRPLHRSMNVAMVAFPLNRLIAAQ